MCAGYNAAMKDSDAKYKVYMHQDVFILNVNFIADIIKIFRENPDYGMLGMAGTERFANDGNYLRIWDQGMLRNGMVLDDNIIDGDVDELTPVKAVDGFMLVTQYDLEWREDIFDGFDFYDISQGMEFYIAGYKVGLPHQGYPWCLHDAGLPNMSNYCCYREIFCNEYKQYGYKFEGYANAAATVERDKIFKENAWKIEQLIESGDAEGAHAILENWSNVCGLDNRLATCALICEIMYQEKQADAHDFFNAEANKITALVTKFTKYKYFLRRVELGFPLEDDEVYREIAARTDKRLIDLCTLVPHVTIEPKATIQRLVETLRGEMP
jgi:hypothetical protein